MAPIPGTNDIERHPGSQRSVPGSSVLSKANTISEDTYKEIHTAANMVINAFRPDWFEQVLTSVAGMVSVREAEVRDAWKRTCYFTNTLHYVHLGQPEHLFIVPSGVTETA
jgi:hypothetical protein